jgi:TetR/AcrR family transcriptional regulator
MPTRSRAERDAAGRPPTVAEQARRQQLVEATIGVIARHGYAGCSLQRIADAAGITKAAVIYHVATKDALIASAYEAVLAQLIGAVGAAVDAAPTPAAAVDAYVAGMAHHLVAHPEHLRMMVETLAETTPGAPSSASRWQPLAGLVIAAQRSGEFRPDLDPRTTALVVGGGLDAVLVEHLSDPTYDVARAIVALRELVRSFAS